MTQTRVGVLDDDALIRTALPDRLERASHTVRVAGSLAEARALLRTGVPDIALLDMKLPDGGGADLFHRRCTILVALPLLMPIGGAELAGGEAAGGLAEPG